jgi:hypothetical protein
MNWHIGAIAHHLKQVRLGRIKRLIINLPPRYLKSLMTSVAFPASTCVVTLVRRSFGSCRQAAAASLPGLSLIQRLEQALQTRG